MPSSTPTHVIIGGFGPIIERPPTPFPFLSGLKQNADTNADTNRDPAVLTPAERNREILCGAIQALCRCEPSRPIDVRALLFPPVPTHPVPTNSSTVGETIPEENTPALATPAPTDNTIGQSTTPHIVIPTSLPPAQFNAGMLPNGRNIPVLDRLAKENTTFLVDSSCHLSERWSEMGMCIARSTRAIIDTRARSQPSPENYPYNMDGTMSAVDIKKKEISPSISLYFMNSAVKVRDILYPDTVLKAFQSVAPVSKRTPLGQQLFEIVADAFPCPPPNQTPVSGRLPLNVIVLTAGYITDDPLKSIEGFRSAMEVLGIKDEQVTITLYQVGCDGGAANLLNSYDEVYNSWGSESERNMVYTEFGQGAQQTISVRSLFRAVSRGMRRRGFI